MPTVKIHQLNVSSTKDRSKCCMPCRRSYKDAPASRKIHIDPTVSRGRHGPSHALAAGRGMRASDQQVRLRCGTDFSASTLLWTATTWRKMCAQVSPSGEGLSCFSGSKCREVVA